jgi:AcrR family transcriptional regulator
LSSSVTDMSQVPALDLVEVLGPVPTRPLRADAARNRARVLQAARATFAERGSEAQIEDVARGAGVGVGTVYRHFATKDALIDALLAERFSELVTSLGGVLEIKDPWEAVVTGFRLAAEGQAQDRCMAGAVRERKETFTATAPIMDELRHIWRELLQRGQAQGMVRPDLTVEDISSLMCGLANVVSSAPERSVWERYLAIILDGLRAAPTSTPLPASG